MRLRIKQDQRGISNVIVVMLSLVILVIISANVILWSYQMNQLDWEKMQENIAILSVTPIRETWFYNPSGYALGGSTSWLSGSVSDLTSDDGVYMTFRSYYSGTDTSDFVDNNTSDVDSSPDKGTHSDFSAQQAGPDAINDTLTEEDTGGGEGTSYYDPNSDVTTQWYVSGSATHYGAVDDGTREPTIPNTGDYIYETRNGKVDEIGLPTPSESGITSIKFWVYSDAGSNAKTTIHLQNNGVTQATITVNPGSSSAWRSATWNNPSSLGTVTVEFLHNKQGGGSSQPSTVYAFYIEVTYTTSNYELDLEVQWTNVDYDETNEELCLYGGTMDPESIRVDVWNGSAWENVFTDLSSGWSNVSVSSYLDSSTFTIRFKGGTEAGDATQDSWNIDVALLHVWSDEHTTEVEFTSSSNTEDWTRLNWTIESAWTIGSVDVTFQLYNYTLDGYPTGGNGYMAYTSDGTPNTDENKKQIITVNPTHFRNATGYWKMKVKGVKATDTQFDFKADWIEFKAVKTGGTLFTFENGGSLTSHLVSLWIINSTVHQRYDISVFVNSGETLPYLRVDICLPSGEYMVKVATERGNIAVYSGS